jgi:hypothetical protein
MIDKIIYRKFISEQWINEVYIPSFEERGEAVPPFIVFQPYVERDGVKGYMIPCKEDDPQAEKWKNE